MQDHWVLRRFAAVDAKDIDGFVDMLSEDHRFIFGGRQPVVGKADARAQVLLFWAQIKRLRHNIWRLSVVGELVYVEANVDYERLDGHAVTVPCCDVIKTRGDKICEQRAYLDQSPIWAAWDGAPVRFDDLSPALEGASD
jgi:ketosteroid isomerase-like protein